LRVIRFLARQAAYWIFSALSTSRS
jgi:hypothetical protein